NHVESASSSGGGIYYSCYNSSSAQVYNSIIAENKVAETMQDITSSYTSDSYKIAGINNLTTFTGWTTSTGCVDYTTSPFVNSATGNYKLSPTSPALDMGNNDYVPSSAKTDLAGSTRICTGIVDLGAYESYSETTAMSLNRSMIGKLTAKKAQEVFSFTIDSSTSVSFQLLNGSHSKLSFRLFGPNTTVTLTASSGEFSLLNAGEYYLYVSSESNYQGSYSFRINTHSAHELILDETYQGTILASHYSKIFQLTTTNRLSIGTTFMSSTARCLRSVLMTGQHRLPGPVPTNDSLSKTLLQAHIILLSTTITLPSKQITR
ncbi:MAG: choice-of-anchor Q domain-containing protein, partial [Planctomycetia bacterium]|nr:choice-of-anchor Q domain-containing protein [Planctomycetia bacterium]